MRKVLVAYASEHGATAEIAQTIAKVLRQLNIEVSARRIEAVESLAAYDAVVIGSAIYLGEWLPEAEKFLQEYQEELAQRSLWVFSSGPTGSDEPVKLVGELVPATLEALVESLHPREVRIFHGKIDLRRLPPEQRELIKAANIPRGDYRDWAAIKLWATNIAYELAKS